MLFGSPDALPQLTPNWDKRFLELDDAAYRFESDPVPLGAIYFLHPRTDDPSQPIMATETIRGGMVDLLGNLSGNYLLDQILPAASFAFLGRLAQRVPLRRLAARANPDWLPQLREMVVNDVTALQAGATGPIGTRNGRDV
jgi:hypothetical protein